MIRSMTGFGEASGLTGAGRLRVELRTVNHRFLNVNARLPGSLSRWEGEIREWLRAHFARGHVNCTARWEVDDTARSPSLRVNSERVSAYLAAFAELSERFGITGSPDLALLTRFTDIIERTDDAEATVEITADELRKIITLAAEQVVGMREEEGRRLGVDLRERIAAIERALARIESAAPKRLVSERERLLAAVAEIVGDFKVDESRIAQEIAILAERWDVNEELVRFRSHNELFLELLSTETSEPIGKRLSFLVQEMHREVNTIGSKANDSEIAHLVVAIKDELERLREQAENVE